MPRITRPKRFALPKIEFGPTFDAVFSHGEAIVHELRQAASVRAKDYRYELDTLRSLAQLAGSGATLWLIHRKARAATYVSIATTAVTAGLSLAQKRKRAQPVDAALDMLPNIFASASLLMPQARETMCNPLDFSPRNPAIPFTPGERLRNIASLYAVYTMVGHWAEMLFCQLIRLGIVDGDYDRSNTMLWDWWLHPFPAEGIAGVLIAGALSPLKDKLLQVTGGRVAPALAASFLVNQLVCTSIDYLTGMVANRNYELWDYREMPFNFQGQICLQNSLVYTTAATLVAWLAYPVRDKWLRRVPSDAANVAFSALAPAYAFVSLLYFA